MPSRPTVSVVICAYTEDRWPQLKKSVASVEARPEAVLTGLGPAEPAVLAAVRGASIAGFP
jgi:hypothetical protein